MKSERAYTLIGPGMVSIGNAWLERSWSAFVGNTVELRQKAGESDGSADRGPNSVLRLGMKPLG